MSEAGEAGAEEPVARSWTRAEAAWAVGLFAVGSAMLAWVLASTGAGGLRDEPLAALFFVGYGIFTISIGYEHPSFGYYSFDRVSQVASILVLGPAAAACVNGLASLLYPWHRLLKGVPLRDVVLASLYNSGLMASIVLICGMGYELLGGQIPLLDIDGVAAPLRLLGLVLAMQVLNDLGMLGLLLARKRDLTGFFQPFSVALEVGSGVTAVLVALVFNSMTTSVFVLLLVVLSLGMAALRQFANVRQKLEQVVAERTRRLEEKTRELEQQAIRDKLTGLYNRRYADEFLDRQLDVVRRHGGVFSVALADIDRFKQINDQHSHAKGDAVLRRVTALLTARCRKSDMIARYGGEEFLICFPGTQLAQARAICEQLREAVAANDWPSLGLGEPVTMSFGVAASRDGASSHVLIAEADVRLYEAKRGGRDLVVA